MKELTKELFYSNWAKVQKLSFALKKSINYIKKHEELNQFILHDVDEEGEMENDQQLHWDGLRIRFQDLQDYLEKNIFRGILLLEEEPMVNRLSTWMALEKRGILNVATWQELRALRNDFAHEYPEDEEDIFFNLTKALKNSDYLLSVVDSIGEYINKTGLLK